MEDLNNKNYENILTLRDFTMPADSVKTENTLGTDNILKADFLFSGTGKWTADKIYYDLPLPVFLKDNPFKNEIRIFPVDFGYGYTSSLVYQLKLPENYNLQDKPDNILLKLPGNVASFSFQTTQTGRLLNINLKLEIENPLIPQEDYADLREFYSKMISHCQQPYVLVKAP